MMGQYNDKMQENTSFNIACYRADPFGVTRPPFQLAGLALLVIGILIEKQIKDYNSFLDGKFHAPPIIIIVVGSLIFIVAFFGCCGAIRESHCMLVTYVVFLVVILIIQIVAAGLAFAYRDDTRASLLQQFDKFVENYETDKGAREMMDSIQQNLKCCGSNDKLDYPHFNYEIPPSCCKNGKKCDRNSDDLFDIGCKNALEDFIEESGNLIGGILIGIAAIEIAGIVFGLCLANSIKNQDRRGR